jgi:hypothetical protein
VAAWAVPCDIALISPVFRVEGENRAAAEH